MGCPLGRSTVAPSRNRRGCVVHAFFLFLPDKSPEQSQRVGLRPQPSIGPPSSSKHPAAAQEFLIILSLVQRGRRAIQINRGMEQEGPGIPLCRVP